MTVYQPVKRGPTQGSASLSCKIDISITVLRGGSFEMCFERCALKVRSGEGSVVRPGSRSCPCPPRIRGVTAPVLSARKRDPHGGHQILHALCISCDSRENPNCSVAHQLQEKVSNARSLGDPHTNEGNPLCSQ